MTKQKEQIFEIALIELFKHHEVIASYTRILLKYSTKIHCLTNRYCFDQLSHLFGEKVIWHLQEEKEQNDVFLAKHWLLLESQDLLIFTTLDIHSMYLNRGLLSRPCMGLIHNSNSFFFPLSIGNLLWSSLHKYIYYLGRTDFLKISRISHHLDYLLVPGQSVFDHMGKRIHPTSYLKLRVMPIAIPEKKPNILYRKIIRITIPGSISQNQRDYKQLLEILPKLDKNITAKVELFLLGKISGKRESRCIRSIQDLPLTNITLIRFHGNVPGVQFDQILDETDFLWLPIQTKIRYRAAYENRGKTCVSGNINDMVRFALPAVLPEFYPLDPDLESMIQRYNDPRELLTVLSNWITHRTYNRIKKDCIPFLNNYNGQVSLAFQEVIDGIMARSRR